MQFTGIYKGCYVIQHNGTLCGINISSFSYQYNVTYILYNNRIAMSVSTFLSL